MSFLYLTEPGAVLHLKQGKLIVKKDDKIITEISKDTVEGVVLTGRVSATSAVFTDFLERGVPVTWLGGSGKFYGRLDNTQKKRRYDAKVKPYNRPKRRFSENLRSDWQRLCGIVGNIRRTRKRSYYNLEKEFLNLRRNNR